MYLAEYTDTFGGEANYCWVRRASIEAESVTEAMRKARKEFGLTGIKGDITMSSGDESWWVPRNACTVLMVRYEY